MKNVIRFPALLVGAALTLSLNTAGAADDHLAIPPGTGAVRQQAGGGTVDDVPVARVNGVAIPRAALVKMMGRMQSRAGSADAAHADSVLRTQALRRLILQELAYQEARARGMTVGSGEVDAAFERIKSSAGDGQAGFEGFLEKEALTEQGLRSLVERNLLLESILKSEVLEKTVVGEKELLAAYERKKEAFATPERVEVAEILFLLDADAEDSRQKAAALLKLLRDDPARSPLDLAPDGTFIVRKLEIRQADDPVLYAAAKMLKPGEISGVISSQKSLHIVQLIDFVPARQATFEEVRGALERDLGARAQQRRLEAWESELRAKATIELPGGADGGK